MFVRSLFADLPARVAVEIWNHPVIRQRHGRKEWGDKTCWFGEAWTYDGLTTINVEVRGRLGRFRMYSQPIATHYGLLLEASQMLHEKSGLGIQPIYLDEAEFPVYVEFAGGSGIGHAIAWPPDFHSLILTLPSQVQEQLRLRLLRGALDCSPQRARRIYHSFAALS